MPRFEPLKQPENTPDDMKAIKDDVIQKLREAATKQEIIDAVRRIEQEVIARLSVTEIPPQVDNKS